MSAFDRDAAREVLRLLNRSDVEAGADNVLDALEACVRPFGWDDMLDLLRTTYSESMIPQYADADYGNGPQVVSLLRLVVALRERPVGDIVLTREEAALAAHALNKIRVDETRVHYTTYLALAKRLEAAS